MLQLAWNSPLLRAARYGALDLALVLGAAACETAPTAAADAAAPFVLTTRGDPVRSNSPPGIELTLGGKRILPTGEPRRFE